MVTQQERELLDTLFDNAPVKAIDINEWPMLVRKLAAHRGVGLGFDVARDVADYATERFGSVVIDDAKLKKMIARWDRGAPSNEKPRWMRGSVQGHTTEDGTEKEPQEGERR